MNPYTPTCATSPEPCLGYEWEAYDQEWDEIDAALQKQASVEVFPELPWAPTVAPSYTHAACVAS